MKKQIFTNDEINLLCLYNTETRTDLIDDLKFVMEFLSSDETELMELMTSVIKKLEDMTDEEFSEIELIPDFFIS